MRRILVQIVFVIAILGGGAWLVSGVIYFFTNQAEWTGQIVEMTWERNLYLQIYKAVRIGNYYDQVPDLAYDVTKDGERQRGTKTEIYWAENGCSETIEEADGSRSTRRFDCEMEREVPVMVKWVQYTLNVWENKQTISASDVITSNEQKIDPQYNYEGISQINRCGDLQRSQIPEMQRHDPLLGCERIAPHTSEVYNLTYLSDDGDIRITCAVHYTQFMNVRVGRPATGKFYTWNHHAPCELVQLGLSADAEN